MLNSTSQAWRDPSAASARLPGKGSDLLAETVTSIARQVVDQASYAANGDLYWLGPLVVEQGRALPRPLGPYLYPGTTGVALFLAACERCGRLEGAGELSLRALAPLRRELAALRAAPEEAKLQHLLGGLSGLGSILYALVRIGDLLEKPELHEEAHFLSSFLTPEQIAADDRFDVMFGSAGALLALLCLGERNSPPNARGKTPPQLAELCAEHLLRHRAASPAGHRSWANGPSGQPVGGFAHGAAGIAYALLRFFALTGREDAAAAAREGIAFERTLFVPDRGDWRIAWRPEPHFTNTWCNGAPGIALGRIGGLPGERDASIEREIELALLRTASPELEAADHLCCGNFGRVEVLLFAARRLDRPDLMEAARQLALRAVERARATGDFGLMPANAGLFDPRLFLGITGIGYGLLHLLEPGAALPCVLAME
ncbi:MAG TPA: lanthionine synthetase LanC family protein [Thermoanaerobaculia bacterium]|nr:lanthionine synthetase LanC family protein [Thermoanaerobaculia bacterium]